MVKTAPRLKTTPVAMGRFVALTGKRLLMSGVGESARVGLQRQIALCNRLALVLCLVSLVVAMLTAVCGFRLLSLATGTIGALLLIIPSWFNHRGGFTASRLTLIGGVTLLICAYGFVPGPGYRIEVGYFACLLLPLILFEGREKRLLWLGATIPSALFLALVAFERSNGILHFSGVAGSLADAGMRFVAYCLICFSIFHQRQANSRVEARLRRTVTSLRRGNRRFRQIIERTEEGVWMTDVNGRTTFVNERMASMLGYTVQELMKINPPEVMVPEDLGPLLERWERRRRGLSTPSKRFDMKYIRKDGSDLWMLVSSGAITDEKGGFNGCFAMHWDITERKGLEGRLLMLGQVLDRLSEGVQVVDDDGYTVYVNPATSRILGFGSEEILGMHISETFPESGTQTRMERFLSMREYTARAGLWSGERRFIRKDGETVLAQTYIFAIQSEGMRYWITVRQDITEKRRTENLLLEQQAKMIAASKMSALGEMSGGIAHEINNPLAIIHGRASQLRKLADAGRLSLEEVAKSAERIEATALRISRIVKSLRAFAREADQDPLQPACIKDIVDDTIELCRERLHNVGIHLIIDPILTDLLIFCRPVQICQVLLNLISNAQDAVEQATERWIRVSADRGIGFVELSVTDSGPGIPVPIREKILQPFFTTKEVGKGTGLGLSVSKGIIESHRGELILDSDCGNTRFVIRLPQP